MKTIIEMAREAKLPVNHPDWADAARRFAALVRADEREKVIAAPLPVQRQWVGLTEEEQLECMGPDAVRLPPGWREVIGWVETKLREKNT